MEPSENNTVGLDPVDPMPWDPIPCPKCNKRFRNEIGLRMHTLRIHSGRGWNTSANFKSKSKTRESLLAQKREYNRKLRARYKKEGRNSRGELMPPGWKPRGSVGWSPERRAKFNSTWLSKNKKKTKSILKKNPIQIVYPDPRQKALEAEAIENTWPEGSGTLAKLKYTPNCGEHIEGWRHQ